MIEGITKAPRRSLYYNSMLTNLLQWKDDNHPRRKEYENIVSMATANMLFVNDVLCGIIVDLGQDLKQDGLLKREVKMLYNKLTAERSKYEKIINRSTGAECMDDFADQQETFYDGIKHDLQVAYYTVKRECDRLRVPASASMTRLHQCRLVCRAALDICQVWEERMHSILPDKYSCYTIHGLRPEGMYGYIRKLHTLLFTPYLQRFGEEEVGDMSMQADEILLKKLVDTKLIHHAATYKTVQESA